MVQGEGSWVDIRELRYGEYKGIRKMGVEGTAPADLDDQVIREHVAAWNWVDDADKELDLPSINPDVIADLTVQEKKWLITAIFQVAIDPNG